MAKDSQKQDNHILPRKPLEGILSEFREALDEEIDKIKTSGQSSTLLYSGRQIEHHGAEFWYRFSVEYMPSLPADTPCKLYVGKDQFDVTVISCEENQLILSSRIALPDTLGSARLENGATVLMELLIKCIEDNAEKENAAGLRMLPPDGGVYQAQQLFSGEDLSLGNGNTDSQNKAIIAALANDITYIWGPPGTGKTTVIGQIIDNLYAQNRSVLVVSHTNTAVDGAIEKAARNYEKKNKGEDTTYPILRIGIPARPLPEKVLLASHIAELGKELFAQKNTLEKQEAEIHQRINQIRPTLAKGLWIEKNNLAAIGASIHNLQTLDSQVGTLQETIASIYSAADQEKQANPQYAYYLIRSKELKPKKQEHNKLCEQISNNQAFAATYPASIQEAIDEQKKHDKYTELKTSEAKYMSVQFYRNELAKIDATIKSSTTELQRLFARKDEAHKIVTTYEQKSSFAKLFAGKSAVTKAQEELRTCDLQIPQIREALERHNIVKQKYDDQLQELQILQEQIKAVIPSKTKEEWIDTEQRRRTGFSNLQNHISEMILQRDALSLEIAELELKIAEARDPFNRLSELRKKLDRTEEQLKQLHGNLVSEKQRCSDLLELEKSFYSAFFFSPESDAPVLLLKELEQLLDSIKREVATVDLSSLREEKEALENNLLEIAAQLNEIKQKMQELEKQAIQKAKIVGATLAKTYLSQTLRERTFDTVILDEASMASIPALWCASYLAEKNVVIVGDFLQLPPIVMADKPMAQKWLGKDIFFHSGMQEAARNRQTCPKNFVMLNDQFRMESAIADIANMYYSEYGGLKSHDNASQRIEARDKFYSWFSGKRTNQSVHLIDTENLHAWVTGVPQGKGHSRLNCFSAAVDVDLAFKFLEKKLSSLDIKNAKPVEEAFVLIVAPYKPHVTRINQLIELEYANRGFKENLNYIRAGTIHSFQGSEADIVIFDLVIDEPHWKANLFMPGAEINADLRKMFNVAVTRAKFKLFVVGNFAYCQKRAKNNALGQLLDKLINKDHIPKEDAKKILPNIAFSRKTDFSIASSLSDRHIVCREDSFNDYLMADIRNFKHRLIIFSPFMTENRLSVLLPAFSDAIAKGKQIIIITKALSDRSRAELTQYRKCEAELHSLGIHIIHKKGMHEKLIFVDSNAVWIGSLNSLSFTGLTGEVMHRHMDQKLTAEYEKLFDIEHINNAVINQTEQQCPVCGSEMLLKDSADGGMFWKCINEDYSRSITQPHPTDGVMRCKCGSPYKFIMKNEPRWVCCENPRHYQKMKKGDLMLPKMVEIIPKASRKDVEYYFAMK